MKKCRGLKGFATGGIVDVPGASRSGVADDIHVDDAPVGGFVLPADSVQALRKSNPELLAQILAAIQQAGGDTDGAATAQIAISNGELFIPPEAVAALGGAEVLNAIKDATHTNVAAPTAKPVDAPPPPGGVNAPLGDVVQPPAPRGLPLGMGGSGALPDAAMPGSGQAQQQRTFFKGGGAVARGLFTGGGLVRSALTNGGENDEDETAKPGQDFNIARSPVQPQPVQQEASFAGDAQKPAWQTRLETSVTTPAVEEGKKSGGVEAFHKNLFETGGVLPPMFQDDRDEVAEQRAAARTPTFSSYAAARQSPSATQPQPKKPANTGAPAAAQQGGWQTGAGGSDNIAWRRRADGTLEATNVFTRDDKGNITGATSAHDPYKIPDSAAGGASPTGLPTGARVVEGSAPVNTISSSAAASPSAAASNALHAARVAAAARGEPTGTEPRGIAGFSAPTVPTMDFYERERVKKAQEEALSAMQARAANTAAKRARGQRIGVAELQAEKDALAGIAGIRAGQLARDDEAAKQNAAAAIGMRNAQAQMQKAMAEAQQPRGMSSASGQGAARPLSGKERIEALQAQMLEGAFGAGTPEARSDYAARVASLNRLLGKGGSDDAAKWTALGDGTGRFVNLPGNARPWAIFDPNSVDDETRRR